jgi:AcrR family transcriptional regulator
MGRPTTITDEQILEAARSVFLEEGFGAATSKVARRAGVSEGTIFKRFQTKEELFSAALEVELPPAWHKLVAPDIVVGDIRTHLESILLALLSFHIDVMPRLIMSLGTPHPGDPKGPLREMPQQDQALLTHWLNQQVAQAKLHCTNIPALTSTILGVTMFHAFQAMLEGQQLSLEWRQAKAHSTLELLWEGIAPARPPAPD